MAIKYEEHKQTELATLHATLIVALLHLTFMQLLLEFFDIYADCFVEDLFPLWQAWSGVGQAGVPLEWPRA